MTNLRKLSAVSCRMAPVLGVLAHHGIELAAGVGLPLEPVLGRSRARVFWVGVLSANLAVAASDHRPARLASATANGVWQALAIQHYVDWPWTVRRGVPILTEADGIPGGWLPAYNTALIATAVAAGAATLSHRTWRAAVMHVFGLATLPIQLQSARRHRSWLEQASSVQICGN